MRSIPLDNVGRVKYQDSLKKGWLTSIRVIFAEPGQVGHYLGPGLRLALFLVEDQFQPTSDFERLLVEQPLPSPIDFEIDPKTLRLSAPVDRLQELPPDQLIAAQEQARQFGYFLSDGRPFNIDGLLEQLQEAIDAGKRAQGTAT